MKLTRLGLLLVALSANAAFALSIADIPDISPKFDEAPVPVKTPPPEYPSQLKNDHISGIVSMVLVIDEKGVVMAAEVAKSTHSGFNQPSLDAVRNWRFKPGKLAGKEVKIRVKVPLQFNVAD